MPEGQMPPDQGGAPAEGGGIAEAVSKLDGDLSQFVEMASQAQEVPDSVKQKLGAALEAWRSALGELSGGGGDEPEPAQMGATSPEQGANPNAVPHSMGRR